jgi:hypothetical protein
MLVGFVCYVFRGCGCNLSIEDTRDKVRQAIGDLETPLDRAPHYPLFNTIVPF